MAIDVGTSYSGYAFSFRNQPSNIKLNSWGTHANDGSSFKAPSAILLNKEYRLIAFGYDAEKKYANLILKERPDNYIFVKNFKTKLMNDTVRVHFLEIIHYHTSVPVPFIKSFLSYTLIIKNVRYTYIYFIVSVILQAEIILNLFKAFFFSHRSLVEKIYWSQFETLSSK